MAKAIAVLSGALSVRTATPRLHQCPVMVISRAMRCYSSFNYA